MALEDRCEKRDISTLNLLQSKRFVPGMANIYAWMNTYTLKEGLTYTVRE